MAQSGVLSKNDPKTGRAAGGAARMASLSPEQRRQLASAAASARWKQAENASKKINNRGQQALIARMCKELSALREKRQILDHQILGLTKAVESFGVNPETLEAE
jgi:hypothetical protein